MNLWYQKPADSWDEALPLGNGMLGAMVYGGMENERIQLNEDSLWSGSYIDRNNIDAYGNLEGIRRMIFDGNIKEAQKLAIYALSGTPQSQRCYQTLGDLQIAFENQAGKVGRYRRELDLDRAITTVNYEIDGQTYERELFISYQDKALIIKLKTSKSRGISFSCQINRNRHMNSVWQENEKTIAYKGDTGSKGIAFTGMLRAESEDGIIKTIGEHLIVENASNVVLYFTAATSFREENPTLACKKMLKQVLEKSYDEIYQRHIDDYQSLFKRVDLRFTTTDCTTLPTDERIERFSRGGEDAGLIALYFQYGRYLLISSSREGSLPANLQGIWCEDFMPPWDSKYTININAQMNYWLAENCNLPECHMPLFALMERMKTKGMQTARKMYGCRGTVAHHNTDIYGDTAPQDQYVPGTYWVMGMAWLCTHIWEHYLFTQDIEFLKKNYDIVKQTVRFFEDFLIENENGELVTCPSVSPENTYRMENGTIGSLCIAPTMDIQILNTLFSEYSEISKILGRDESEYASVEKMRSRLPKMKIGKKGQLQEWMEDYEETEPGHRHLSHLFGVYPDAQINQWDTPKLYDAARKSVAVRMENGSGQTGWSCAWALALYARFGEGDSIAKGLRRQFELSTFSNLMDGHPFGDGKVFQIDGNFGTTAAITEMLVQSHQNRIVILPALPKECRDGKVKGLKLRGNAEISMAWENAILTDCEIYPYNNFEAMVIYNDESKRISFKKGVKYIYCQR